MSENCPRCGALRSSLKCIDQVLYKCGTVELTTRGQWEYSAECKRREPLHKHVRKLEDQLDECAAEITGYAASLDDQDKLRRKAEADVERLKAEYQTDICPSCANFREDDGSLCKWLVDVNDQSGDFPGWLVFSVTKCAHHRVLVDAEKEAGA